MQLLAFLRLFFYYIWGSFRIYPQYVVVTNITYVNCTILCQ